MEQIFLGIKMKIRIDYELVSKNERNISIRYFNKIKTFYGTSIDFRIFNVLIVIDFIFIGKE
tara:strand:- start:1657 stop:1842 length:186 start_codon:yes stop_codon:yes gene_type:complete